MNEPLPSHIRCLACDKPLDYLNYGRKWACLHCGAVHTITNLGMDAWDKPLEEVAKMILEAE